MRKIKNNFSKLNVQGLNIDRLINKLKDSDIKIYNMQRVSYDNLTMVVDSKDVPAISNNNVNIEVLDTYGSNKLLKLLLQRIGIVIGVLLSIIMIIILNMFTLHIEILGIENITKEEVIDTLNNYGIDIWQINNYNKDDLNNYLSQNLDDISLVSTKKIGTTLVINIKEKSSTLEESAQNYISPYNMIIRNHSVNSGKSNIRNNQVVKKGDLLIYTEEYIDSDGVLHLINPKATLDVTIWHTATETFMKQETIYNRTGNSVNNYCYSIGNLILAKRDQEYTYQYCEEESRDYYISNYLLPIKYISTTYYETVPEVIENDFANSKEKIIANLKSLVYNKSNANETVVDEKVDIVELDDRFIINYYLECNTTIYVN